MDSFTHLETAALIVAAVLAMLTNLVRLLRTVLSIHTYYLKAQHTSNRRVGSSFTEPMLYQYRRTYLILMIVEPIIITATQATFFALSWNKGDDWTLYLTSSIIISSMVVEVSSPGLSVNRVDHRQCIEGSGTWCSPQRSFSPYPLFSVLTICLTHFVSGTVIEGRLQSLGRAFSSASVVLYRLWIVWEWARLVRDTWTNKVLIWMKLLSCIVACLATVYPLLLSSRMSRLLVSCLEPDCIAG